MATESKLKEDIKKLEAGIKSKATPEKIKGKLKNQLAILNAELSALQKPAPSKMSRAKQLRAKYKALYGVRFQGIDIEKDAAIPALPMGKRISQGLKGNKTTSKKNAKGHVYYEYRENRIDMKQPPKKYPKLEDGGYMAKGGSLISIKKKYEENEDENAHSENVVLLAKNFGTDEELLEAKKILSIHNKEGHLSSENGKKRQELHLRLIAKARKEMSKEGISFEDGGMMAKGGKTEEKLTIANDEQKFGLKILRALSNFNDGKTLNGILEVMGLSNYKFNQYASASTVMKVKKELKSLVKKGLVEEGGIGFVITRDGAKYLRSFEYGSYKEGGKLIGKQKNLDVNKNGKLDSEDFKMLRGEKMAKGGELNDLLKQQEELEFDLTDIKLGSDLNTHEGVEKYRKLVAPVRAKLNEIDKKLEALGYEPYAKGGMSQGYDDREDERLAMKYGKIKGKYLDSTHARRDDARFEERGKMAKGGEFPMANSTMIGKMITIKLPNEIESFKDKVVEEFSDSVMGKKGFWSKKYIVKKSEDGGYFDKKSDVEFKFSVNEKIKVLQYNGGKLKKEGATIIDQYAAEQPDGTYYPFYWVVGDWEDMEEGKKHPLLYPQDELIERHGNKPKEMADGGMMAEGGEVNGDNMEMVVSQIKAIKHHAEELSKIVTPSTPIEAWVVAKIERSETDLSDVTHYLDGLKMEHGGRVSSSQHRLNR